jgi:hypothetical protein
VSGPNRRFDTTAISSRSTKSRICSIGSRPRARSRIIHARGAAERDGGFTTFVSSFTEPAVLSEERFEERLWQPLQQLHDLDASRHAWNGAVSADPADPHFAFSFAGMTSFIVGLHATSSRAARRAPGRRSSSTRRS